MSAGDQAPQPLRPQRDKGGRFAARRPRPAGTAVIAGNAVERERRAWISRGMRGSWAEDSVFTRALNRRANEIMAGVERGHRLWAELRAEVVEYVKAEAMLAAVDAFILSLQDRVIDKKKRRLHQIMHDRRGLAEQLGTQRERIARLKSAVDLEARMAAIEKRQGVSNA